MTGSLLFRIWIFVAGAFGLGLLVGWMFWRLHRSSLPIERWRAEQADRVAQRRRADQLAAERDALVQQVARVRSDAARLAALLARAWEDREAWHRQALELEATAAALRAELTGVDARLRYLQRRATERAVAEAVAGPGRGDGVMQQPNGPGGLASPR